MHNSSCKYDLYKQQSEKVLLSDGDLPLQKRDKEKGAANSVIFTQLAFGVYCGGLCLACVAGGIHYFCMWSV